MESEITPIRQALYRGDRAGAEKLVAAGAEPNVFDAAALGDAPRLTHLVASEPAGVYAWSADGFTALHFARVHGRPGGGACPARCGRGRRRGRAQRDAGQPLHSAAANGNVESCRLLLEAGADPNARQQRDFTPMDEAVQENNEAVIALLRSHGA